MKKQSKFYPDQPETITNQKISFGKKYFNQNHRCLITGFKYDRLMARWGDRQQSTVNY